MSAVLQPAPVESYEAELVRTRRMTRAQYREARCDAHRLETRAQMMRHATPRDARADALSAARIRADIAPPTDIAEAARERAWLQLRLILEAGCRATATRKHSRQLTQSHRRRRDDVGPELRAVRLPVVAPPANPINQTDEE